MSTIAIVVTSAVGAVTFGAIYFWMRHIVDRLTDQDEP